MKIQNKLFVVLFGFSVLLVVGLVSLMQWSIGKGMVEYVNAKEVIAIQPVIEALKTQYSDQYGWRSMQDNHPQFRQYITSTLRGSAFSPSPQGPPEHRRGQRPPRDNHRVSQPPPREERPPRQAQGSNQHDRNMPPRHSTRPNNNEEMVPAQMRPSREDELRSSQGGFTPTPPSAPRNAYYALLDNDGNYVVGRYHENLDYSMTPITMGDTQIGFFAVSKRSHLTQGYEFDFVEQQQSHLFYIAIIALLGVALVTLPLSRHLVSPIKRIKSGMHKLTLGDYQQTLDLPRKDEMGDLARHFNELALTLRETDETRKRWLANTSHELRTPVAILRGELEAMLDGVRPMSKENLNSITDEVKHLQKLVDDLNQLTSADIGGMKYRKTKLDIVALLNTELVKYRGYLADSNIVLELNLPDEVVLIYADKTRLNQLFENIINNCNKYSSATSLSVTLHIEEKANQRYATIAFSDNGIGVDHVHLPNLFEHLYRVEDSRNRKTGGSGLGLSICRHIINGHEGEIYAEQTFNGGLTIIVKLPIL